MLRFASALWVVLVTLLTMGAGAQAPALDVSHLRGGPAIAPIAYALRDPQGNVTLAEAMAADARGGFERDATKLSFGFTSDAVWLRFDVVNTGSRQVAWLLELAYPHLDFVDLWRVRADGHHDHRRVGDHLPFATRELDHPNLLFEQTMLPGERVRFYLRAQSNGSLRIPLRAWAPRDFIVHDAHASIGLWMFFGAMLAMAWYNICVAAVIRSREHLFVAGLLTSIVCAIATLSGQMFQWVLPLRPQFANRALGTSIALAVLFVTLYAREVASKLERPPAALVRAYTVAIPPSYALVVFVALAPQRLGSRAVLLSLLVYVPLGLGVLWYAQRLRDPQLRFSVLSFYPLIALLPVTLAAHANLIPPYPLALWAGHIGSAAYCIIASLALPVRLKTVSARLAALNAQLSSNVDDLKLALARAEQATEDARRATLVKDEFMATMSHELRTPLNAIINVPQGLLEDFPTVLSATCTACGSQFVLDPGERIHADVVCPDCQERGALQADTITQYVGKPAHTARFLAKIERSGRHLLQMVNGVLDFSKMEAGRLELSLEALNVAELLHETADELIDVARARGIDIALHLADDPDPGLGDPVRLRQVLLNLLSNAIKFSSPNSVIDVRWKRDPDNDVISVTDRGIGIAPEDHSRVFASFEQVHKGDTRKYGGTGLGLSISRSLVRMHGGEMWVESRLGEGATFTFRIPRANATISDRADDRAQPRPPPPPPPTA